LAVWQLYLQTHDKQLLSELFPKLLAYHQWWYKNRDHNHNGLVEYGATKHPQHNNAAGQLSFKVQYSAQQQKLNKNLNTDLNTSNDLKTCQPLKNNWYQCYSKSLYQKVLTAGNYQQLTIGAQDAAAWESGMDNAARFGFISAKQLTTYAKKHYQGNLTKARLDWQVSFLENKDEQGNLSGFSINQESVELNSYLAQEKFLLSNIANILQKNNLSKQLQQQAKKLSMRINQCFYDKKNGYYYDLQITSFTQSHKNTLCNGTLLSFRGKGPEGWSPLWTNIADKSKAKNVVEIMLSEDEFNSTVPFPSAALSNPAFNENSYWRGRVWLDQFYFAVVALKNYGYNKQANNLIEKLLHNAQGLNSDQAIRENYNPQTGKQQGATNFSWSAAHLYLLLTQT